MFDVCSLLFWRHLLQIVNSPGFQNVFDRTRQMNFTRAFAINRITAPLGELAEKTRNLGIKNYDYLLVCSELGAQGGCCQIVILRARSHPFILSLAIFNSIVSAEVHVMMYSS